MSSETNFQPGRSSFDRRFSGSKASTVDFGQSTPRIDANATVNGSWIIQEEEEEEE